MTVLLVLLALIAFVIADYVVQRRRPLTAEPGTSYGRTDRQGVLAYPENSSLPDEVVLAVNHTWLRNHPDGPATLGIDDFLAHAIGTVDGLVLPEPGSRVSPTACGITMRCSNRNMSLASPLHGRVLEVNEAVLQDPSLAVSDPYGRGWLLKIAPDPRREMGVASFAGRQAAEWLASQRDLAKEFFLSCAPEPAAILMQDGGVPVNGALDRYDDAVWQAFQQWFVSVRPKNG